jgi:hypothetical protein
MANRRFRNKKVRLVAIGASLATGAAVVTVLLPSANAAEEKTPEQIIAMCKRAEVLNGKRQSTSDFGGGLGDGFAADRCDYVETKFETFDGPTKQVTVDFPNCEPNATKPATVTTEWSAEVGQGQGRFTETQQGGGGGLFGVLNGFWQKHQRTLDMTIKSVIARESEERSVPAGKVLHVEFTPKMHRMTGVWKVHSDAREATTVTNPVPEVNLEAEEVVEGPGLLVGAAGAPRLADGTTKAVLTDC